MYMRNASIPQTPPRTNQLFEQKTLKVKKESEIVINNTVLRQHSMTVADLSNEIYKQSVHDKRHLLTHDDNSITLSFNYPKCTTKPITFHCQWKSTQQPVLQALKVQQTLKAIDNHSNFSLDKLTAYVDSKLASTVKTLTEHYKKLIKMLNHEMQQRIMEFNMMISRGTIQQEERFKLFLKETMEKILDSNNRYFDQFKLMKTNLQTSIAICDQNIKEISMQVNDLRSFMRVQQERMEDEATSVSLELKELQENVRHKFKELKTILKSQLDQKKYALSESLQKQANYLPKDSPLIGIPSIGNKATRNEEKTASLPILDRETLSQLPLSTQVILSEHSPDKYT